MKKILFVLFIAIILILTIKGQLGVPTSTDINQNEWKENGPFELSPERGRFALIYSIVEDKSLIFSIPVARFVTPDLGYINGKYVSLFAPAVSFLAIPGYLVGKYIGISQVGAFATSSLFALLNVLLIRAITKKLGASEISSNISSMLFLFASPAFSYSTTLYQHHISTFLILLSIYSLIVWDNYFSLALIWFLFAASIPVDYPNIFLMIPIVIYSIRKLFVIKKDENYISLRINLAKSIGILSLIIPLLFFLWFNNASYGNPLQLSGTIKAIKEIDEFGNPALSQLQINTGYNLESVENKTPLSFFKTRNSLRGLYIHLVSYDRGILIYTPIMIFSFIGVYIFYKKKIEILPVLVGVFGFNLLLYSMWGDPWGGWAFGSRYMIPSYAIMTIFIGSVLDNYKSRSLFILLFLVVAIYSIIINSLGAITTIKIPPKIEVVALQGVSGRVERYSYDRNWEFLKESGSKSFIYKTYLFNKINPFQYYILIVSVLVFVIGGQIILLIYKNIRNN